VAKKIKPGRPSTFERGLRHPNHVKINARILGNVMVMQRQNDQKVVNLVHAKTQREWDKLIIVVKQCPSFPQLTLVKLASDQLLKVLGPNA
jgi:hypothetical protein